VTQPAKIKRASFLLASALIVLLSINACQINPQPNSQQKQEAARFGKDRWSSSGKKSYDLPENAVITGILFSSLDMNMVIILDHPDWVYHVDKSTGQTYFFNKLDTSGNNMISISAFDFDGDAADFGEEWWGVMNGNFKSFGVVIDFKGEQRVEINNGYIGYRYVYEVQEGPITISCSVTFWEAEGKFYTCTTSADPEHVEEVHHVLDGIFTYFQPITKKPAR